MVKNKQQAHTTSAAKSNIGFMALKEAKVFSFVRLAVILALVAVFVYANTLKNGYALDDVSSITRNLIVKKGIPAIPQLLTTPYHLGFHPSDNDLYRPLSLVMFAVEYQFFPDNPAIGHFLNILLFGVCVVALFLFLVRLLGRPSQSVAFIACLLFAVHPIHTEVVANIKSRDELLCFFFAILSLLSFVKFVEGGRWLSLLYGGAYFFLSLMAKETSITFLAVIPLVFYLYLDRNKRRSTIIMVTAVLISCIYLAIRHYVLHTHHADMTTVIPFVDNALVDVPPPASQFATAVLLLGIYIKLLFVPWPLLCDYSFNSIPYVGYGHWGFLLSLAAYISLISISVYRLWCNRKDLLAFAILFFLITLSLFSNIFFLLGATMAERFLFFPSVGFCIAIAWLVSKWQERSGVEGDTILNNKKMWLLLLPVLVVLGWHTIGRNSEWKDNYTLYSADLLKAPDNMRLRWFRGNELTTKVFEAQTADDLKLQAMTEGIKELQQAIAIYPLMLPAHLDLGHAFFMMQQFDSSILHSRKVLLMDPYNAIALFNISGVHFSNGRYDSAIAYCHMAAKSDPDNFDIPRNIAFSWLQLGQYDSSIVYFKKVLFQYPDDGFCNGFLAKAYQGAGMMDSSKKYEQLARYSTR